MRLGVLLGITGLLLDIMGAWFISKGLVKKKLDDIRQEAPGFSFAANEAYIISVLTQKIEATVGFVLLSSGFLFQVSVYGLYDFNSTIIWIGVPIIDLLGLILVWVISHYVIGRKITTARKIVLREQLLRNGYSYDKPMHIQDAKRYLRYLKIKHEENIGIEQVWFLLLKTLGIDK